MVINKQLTYLINDVQIRCCNITHVNVFTSLLHTVLLDNILNGDRMNTIPDTRLPNNPIPIKIGIPPRFNTLATRTAPRKASTDSGDGTMDALLKVIVIVVKDIGSERSILEKREDCGTVYHNQKMYPVDSNIVFCNVFTTDRYGSPKIS